MKSLVIIVLIAGLVFLISSYGNTFVYAQEENKKQNDLVFEVQGLRTSPITKNLRLSGVVWEKICPSNQCQIEEGMYSNITTPDPDDTTPQVFVTLYFYVHDNITNKDLTPIQKKSEERYDLTVSCVVNSPKDLIEQANSTIYKCSSERTDLQKFNREQRDPTYYFKIEGTYDSQSDILTVTGKYAMKS